MPPRSEDLRWSTRFGVWVATFGVAALVEALAREGDMVSVQAVYHWLRGGASPRFARAMLIVQVSSGGVSFEDIVAHRSLLASCVKASAATGSTPPGAAPVRHRPPSESPRVRGGALGRTQRS
jgi:hypothetical protein